MHDIAGLVALAAIGLWIAYLVPHRLRYRQQLLESRTEDRFSGALRVLVVADSGRRRGRAVEARTECGPGSAKRSGLLSPARGVPVGTRSVVTAERGGVVERPHGTQDTISADDARRAAQQRARRAAAVSRRAAAARRRAALTGVLLVASVIAWVVVGLTPVAATVAVVPTLLLAGIVVLGRRAVVSARRADEAWERQLERAARPAAPRAARVTGRALRPSDSHTEAIAQVGPDAVRTGSQSTVAEATPDAPGSAAGSTDDVTGEDDADRAEDAPAPAAEATAPETSDEVAAQATDDGWSPVPVPRPTYTTKATAPRREPLPLVMDDGVATEAGVPAMAGPADDAAPVSSPVDLDAILARRRAAGE